jgi:hypothetical protein
LRSRIDRLKSTALRYVVHTACATASCVALNCVGKRPPFYHGSKHASHCTPLGSTTPVIALLCFGSPNPEPGSPKPEPATPDTTTTPPSPPCQLPQRHLQAKSQGARWPAGGRRRGPPNKGVPPDFGPIPEASKITPRAPPGVSQGPHEAPKPPSRPTGAPPSRPELPGAVHKKRRANESARILECFMRIGTHKVVAGLDIHAIVFCARLRAKGLTSIRL